MFFQAQLQKEEDKNWLELHAKLEKLEILEKECLKLTATQRIAEVSMHGMTVWKSFIWYNMYGILLIVLSFAKVSSVKAEIIKHTWLNATLASFTMSLFFSLGFKIPAVLFYPRLQLQATSDFWFSMANWSVTNHSCLQIQDKIKNLEEKLCKEEHQRKLIQDKTAQVDWKGFILSYFWWLKKAILSVQNTLSFITFKLHMFITQGELLEYYLDQL